MDHKRDQKYDDKLLICDTANILNDVKLNTIMYETFMHCTNASCEIGERGKLQLGCRIRVRCDSSRNALPQSSWRLPLPTRTTAVADYLIWPRGPA